METFAKDLFKVAYPRSGYRHIKKIFLVILISIFFMCLCAPIRAAEFNVDNAAALQAALTTAQGNGEDDTIRAAQGTYIGNFTYEALSGENYDITIEGGWSIDFNSRTLTPTNTILDGNHTERVLMINNRTNDTTGAIKIEGFTIKNGLSTPGGYGGGITAFTFPPGVIEINQNIIEDNETDGRAGGLYALNHTADTGAPIIITNNIIRNNKTGSSTVAGNPFGGGGMLYTGDTLILYNNLIFGNEVRGAVQYEGSGGGLAIIGLAGDIYLINNTIVENVSHGFGGGVTAQTFSSAWANSHSHFYNNIIRGNTYGGWLGDADIFNTISSTVPAPGNTLTISHTNYQGYGVWPGSVTPTLIGNINALPGFVGSGDYHLQCSSPCVDTGDNSALELPSVDLDGGARIIDANHDGTPTVDMGAYELGAPVIESVMYDPCISELCTSAIGVSVNDPGGCSLAYTWEALDGGDIIGEGASVAFDPPGPGAYPACESYRVKVTVTSEVTGLDAEETIDIYVKLAGDVDGNGVVNILDKVWVRNHFGQNGLPGWINEDVDCSGAVNILDKVEVRNQFGQTGCGCE